MRAPSRRPTGTGSGNGPGPGRFGRTLLPLGVLAVAVLAGVLAVQQLGTARALRALNQRVTLLAERVEALGRAAGTAIGSGGNATSADGPAANTAANTAALTGDGAALGSSSAPVTIVEYSDFECPFCRRFYRQTLPQLRERYVASGQVRLVFRHLPSPGVHPNALGAAAAAECAGEQGEFWAMHDLLFERGVAGGGAQFRVYATELGLDADAFTGCVDGGNADARIAADRAAAASVGARATPSFMVIPRAGQPAVFAGARQFEVFEQLIEAALR